jgi:hypothetical protein
MGEIVIQDCGCIAIPEEIAAALGMGPGVRLGLAVDAGARSITLTAPVGGGVEAMPVLAACPVKTGA